MRDYITLKRIEAMKIIVSTGNVTSSSPQATYLAADTSVTRTGRAFYVPHFATSCTARLAIAWHIALVGKTIAERHAARYCQMASPAVLLSACPDSSCDARWVAFDGSLLLGEAVAVDVSGMQSLSLLVNGEERATGTTGDLCCGYASQLSQLSRHFTFKTGDLLLSDVSAAEVSLSVGDRLEASLDGASLLQVLIK